MCLNRTLIACLYATMILSVSCTKNDTPSTALPDPVIPDFSVRGTTALSGYVTDTAGHPVPYARIYAGDKLTTTDATGYFSFSQVSLPRIAAVVRVEKNSYYKGFATFVPRVGKETFVQLRLLKKSSWAVADAAEDDTLSIGKGIIITLPANGVVKASNGGAYNGQVFVYARQISYADETGSASAMPGDASATDSNGYLTVLQSFGTIAVELTAIDGQPLQLADGKSATVTIPIPAELNATAPTYISLWSFNESTGLWKEDGNALKANNAYTATVTHFSFWNGAIGFPAVKLSVKLADEAGNPLVHVPVSITPATMPDESLYGRFGFTDADGYITGAVASNANLLLNVLSTNASKWHSYPFRTSSNNIDLLTVKF